MPVFSFIIPVYNAESVVERCLKSIEKQTFDDYEVIIIDDGSVDQSLNICQKYADLHQNWSVLKQSNCGPSCARNHGIEQAEGRYICFLDSDDYIDDNYLRQLYSVIDREPPDVIFFGYQKEYTDRKSEVFIPETGHTDKSELCYWLSRHDLYGYTWVKCFASKAIGQNRFNEDMKLFEDEVFTCEVMRNCKTVSVLPQVIHHYVIGNADALTMRTHQNYCSLLDTVYDAWEEMLASEGNETYLQNKANAFTAMCRYYGLERRVNVRQFYGTLKQTAFYKAHTNTAAIDRYIANSNYSMIVFHRMAYRLKQKASRLLHRR